MKILVCLFCLLNNDELTILCYKSYCFFSLIGQYQCFAENVWGTATSKSVMVVKTELSSFKDEPPLELEAHEGDPFKLACQPPTGWPKPNVYWIIRVSTLKNIYLFRIYLK